MKTSKPYITSLKLIRTRVKTIEHDVQVVEHFFRPLPPDRTKPKGFGRNGHSGVPKDKGNFGWPGGLYALEQKKKGGVGKKIFPTGESNPALARSTLNRCSD
jgi:hypothetical protein